jgi:hypothetical protein
MVLNEADIYFKGAQTKNLMKELAMLSCPIREGFRVKKIHFVSFMKWVHRIALCSTRAEIHAYKYGHRHIHANQWCSLSSFAVFLFLWFTASG